MNQLLSDNVLSFELFNNNQNLAIINNTNKLLFFNNSVNLRENIILDNWIYTDQLDLDSYLLILNDFSELLKNMPLQKNLWVNFSERQS